MVDEFVNALIDDLRQQVNRVSVGEIKGEVKSKNGQAEKKLTTKQVETLINKGKTSEIKGFISKKTGKSFSAILVLQDKATGKVGFAFN